MKISQIILVSAVVPTVLWVSGCCGVPGYSPEFWNDGSTVQFGNNCYNYGNNKRTDTYAQPGRRSGDFPNPMTCADVSAAAISDGIEAVRASGGCVGGQHKMALVVDPGVDYHWYRNDILGNWSHKPGRTRATNLDNSGNTITNPETADRCGDSACYTDFCGYFCSCSEHTEGIGHEDID